MDLPLAPARGASLGFALCLLCLAGAGASFAATLSDPAVDRYNVRVGTQTFDPLYHFTTNTLLVETANAITNLGSDIIKFKLNKSFGSSYGVTLGASITNLMNLARDEPSCRHTFDMPFRHYLLWAYAFSTAIPDWNSGYSSPTTQANDYREFYDLTRYLLTNYNNSGKTFYLGHWEGDGYLCPNSSWGTNPTPTMVQGFINYLNNRQKAIDDAKGATTFTNVNVFGYAEANRVRDAINNNPASNIRMINAVIPFVTNLDYVSYSSYDMQRLNDATRQSTMDYMEAHLPTNKVSTIPGERIWIGEYSYANAGDSPATQEPETRAYIQWLLNYGRQALPYILYWEIYDNEKNSDGTYKYLYLIDQNNVKAPCWYLHQRYINNARLFTAQFKERNGRLPTDAEFVALVTPMLNSPLPAPVNLTVANGNATLLSPTSASVSGTLAQGVYGDDDASVWVYYGAQDGGTVRAAWAQRQMVGINTNFNPATFTAGLANLAANTNYFFRFYATNSSGEAWAPATAQFSTEALDPAAFRFRLRVSFTGYNRGEPLLNFPALLNLSTALPGFDYNQFASPAGGDLRFTDSSGRLPIPFEIDEWNPAGTSKVWVRLPQLATTNDCVWDYWGNPAATNPPSSTTNGTAWSTDHWLVWHLKQTGFPYADSAQEHPGLSGTAPASSTGEIGKGCLFDGLSQYVNAGPVNIGGVFTLSAWVKLDPGVTNCATVLANKPGGWNSAGFALYVNSYQTSDQQLRLETGDGTTGTTAATGTGAVSFGAWHQVDAVVNQPAGSAHLFVDGVDRTQSGAVATDFPTQTGINLGRFTNSTLWFKGTLDEVRIANAARSSNWVWASWMTAAANTSFQNYSAVNPRPALAVVPAGGGLTVSWPASSGVFALFTTTNVSPPATWVPVTNSAVLTNGQWQVLLGTGSNDRQFYRLQQ